MQGRQTFTGPHISLQGMIDRSVGITTQGGIMPQMQAGSLMSATLPTLKRWQAT